MALAPEDSSCTQHVQEVGSLPVQIISSAQRLLLSQAATQISLCRCPGSCPSRRQNYNVVVVVVVHNICIAPSVNQDTLGTTLVRKCVTMHADAVSETNERCVPGQERPQHHHGREP